MKYHFIRNLSFIKILPTVLIVSGILGFSTASGLYLAGESQEQSKAKELRASTLVTAITRKFDETGQKISLALSRQADLFKKDPSRNKALILRELGEQLASISGLYIYYLDADQRILHTSHTANQSEIGQYYPGIQSGLSLTEIKAKSIPHQSKHPIHRASHFDWLQDLTNPDGKKTGSLMAQVYLFDLKNWCQLFANPSFNMLVALIPSDPNHSIFECGDKTKRFRFWDEFREEIKTPRPYFEFPFLGKVYSIHTKKSENIPVTIAVATESKRVGAFIREYLLLFSLFFLCMIFILILFSVYLAKIFRLDFELIEHHIRNKQQEDIKNYLQITHFKETDTILEAIWESKTNFKETTERDLTLWKIEKELSSCLSPSSIVNKAAELIYSIEGVTKSWFIFEQAHFHDYQGLGWICENQRSRALSPNDLTILSKPDREILCKKFAVLWDGRRIGDIYLSEHPGETSIDTLLVSDILKLVDLKLNSCAQQTASVMQKIEEKIIKPILDDQIQPFEFDGVTAKIATFYKPPSENKGDFFHIKQSISGDDILIVCGGPSHEVRKRNNPNIFRHDTYALIWGIYGLIQSYERQLNYQETNKDLTPTKIKNEILKQIYVYDKKNLDQWSFFIGRYSVKTRKLQYTSRNRFGPILVRDIQLKNNGYGESLYLLPNSKSEINEEEKTFEIPQDQMALFMLGENFLVNTERHKLYRNVILRHIYKTHKDTSCSKLRDELRSLHEFFYQKEPIEVDSCIILIASATPHVDFAKVS